MLVTASSLNWTVKSISIQNIIPQALSFHATVPQSIFKGSPPTQYSCSSAQVHTCLQHLSEQLWSTALVGKVYLPCSPQAGLIFLLLCITYLNKPFNFIFIQC